MNSVCEKNISLEKLHATVEQVANQFESCWVFTFGFRQQLIDGLMEYKSSVKNQNNESLNDLISVLEILTTLTFQGGLNVGREALSVLAHAISTLESIQPLNPEHAQAALLKEVEFIWSWIERTAS